MNQRLMAARTELVYKQPFFASILMKRPFIKTTALSTMGVDRAGRIYYNEDFLNKLTREEIIFTLCHEVMHVVCMHALRKGSRDHELWNVAGDLFINSFLYESGIRAMPKGVLFEKGSENKTTEQIYDELMNDKDKPDYSKQLKDSEENGSGTGFDLSEEGSPMTQEEIREAEVQTKLDIADAARVTRERGQCTGALERMINNILEVRMKWYEQLEKYFSGFTTEAQSWERPNRRFISSDIYLPINDKQPSMGTVVVGIDTSGSIGDEMLRHFGGHLNAILEQCRPEKVYVVYCDSEVKHVDEFQPVQGDIVTLKAYGGGGTDMREITKWIAEQGLEPDVCCILTDGWTPFPTEASCPLVWALTEGRREDIPLGEVVEIEME